MPDTKKFDVAGFIIAYEDGELNGEESVVGFQELIDKGVVWKLQGGYGRQAISLIEAGHCVDTHGVLSQKGGS